MMDIFIRISIFLSNIIIYKMSNIRNNTEMPQDSNLRKFVERAVNKHFSDVLDIETQRQ